VYLFARLSFIVQEMIHICFWRLHQSKKTFLKKYVSRKILTQKPQCILKPTRPVEKKYKFLAEAGLKIKDWELLKDEGA